MTSDKPAHSGQLNRLFSTGQLKQAVRGGARAMVVGQFASQVVSLGVLAALYRLLDPKEFGLAGMVLPLLLILRSFTIFSFNIGTIQHGPLSHDQVSSLFWLQVALGVLTAALTAMLAPAVAWFYGESSLLWLTLGVAATSIIAALGAQHQALMERNLHLGRLVAARLAAQVLAGGASIAAAFASLGVWSLVLGLYVELAVISVAVWRLEPWRPDNPRRHAHLRDLIHVSGYFAGTNLAFQAAAYVDKIFVGYFLGAFALGLYSQAFQIAMKPVSVLTTPLVGLMLPALSRARSEPQTYAQLVAAFFRLVAVVCLPAGIGLAIVAPEAIEVLGGPKWREAAPLLSILSLTILVQGLINVTGSVFTSAGEVRRMFWAALAMPVVILLGLGAGLQLGRVAGAPTAGAAWGYTATTCLVIFVPYMAYCLRCVGVSIHASLQPLLRPAAAAAAMGAVVWLCRQGLGRSPSVAAWQALVILIAAGVASYTVFAWRDIQWCLRHFLPKDEPSDDPVPLKTAD